MCGAALTARMGGSILHPNVTTLRTITDSGPVSDTIIQINDISGTLMVAWELTFSALDMGHLPTPDSWPLICIDEGKNDQVYDSDGQIGPFFNMIYDEAPLHIGDK